MQTEIISYQRKYNNREELRKQR